MKSSVLIPLTDLPFVASVQVPLAKLAPWEVPSAKRTVTVLNVKLEVFPELLCRNSSPEFVGKPSPEA